MKNYNDTIGNRTLDLQPCSALPQPNAPQRTPIFLVLHIYLLAQPGGGAEFGPCKLRAQTRLSDVTLI